MAYTPQIYYPQSSYLPQYQQPMQMPTMAQAQQQINSNTNQGLIWVSGEIGAKSYLVAPNSTVMLMDSEGDRFYIKSTDSAGMPNIKTYEYKECVSNIPQATQNAQNNMSEQFVTREEYKAICGKYEELMARLDDMQKPRTNTKKKVEVEADE